MMDTRFSPAEAMERFISVQGLLPLGYPFMVEYYAPGNRVPYIHVWMEIEDPVEETDEGDFHVKQDYLEFIIEETDLYPEKVVKIVNEMIEAADATHELLEKRRCPPAVSGVAANTDDQEEGPF